ncbi:hypothetical protein [Chitinophaga sancti]|uniref:Uncharacterized protein n=1 Tax=Chitinophaga sancti TaxID=1004 RepID=A0A1K1S603_9BACT|nr:hypothetical protein [Chitinophaga sancti]SFW79437.1 hypothetical protein SAMN05661012_04804 [Chitinophaga sancti]
MRNLIAFIGIIGCLSCQPAADKQEATSQAQDSIQPTAEEEVIINTQPELKKQGDLQQDLNDEGGGHYKYAEKDLNFALPVIAEILKAKGYVAPSKEVFEKKMHEIFAESYSPGGACRVKEHEKFTMLYEGKKIETPYPMMSDDVVAAKEGNFIWQIPLVSSLGSFVDSVHFKIDLKYTQKLISRNKYFFNDSKADLAILLNEDAQFLSTLVTSFGYTKNQQLNDLVMNEYLKRDKDEVIKVADIIFVKDCKNQLVIREGLLTWVKDHTNKEEHRIMDALYDYVYKQFAYKSDFSLNEKRKIAAYVDNIFIPLKDKYGEAGWPTTELIFNLEANDHEIRDYLKSQHFYDLPEVKNLYGE